MQSLGRLIISEKKSTNVFFLTNLLFMQKKPHYFF